MVSASSRRENMGGRVDDGRSVNLCSILGKFKQVNDNIIIAACSCFIRRLFHLDIFS
jgi:hypothetical protein